VVVSATKQQTDRPRRIRLPSWLSGPQWDAVRWTLVLILLAGAVIRIYFVVVYHPALIGVSDTANYLIAAHTGLFWDPDRVAGYVLFLRLLHFIWPRLILVSITQHILGLVGAALLFDTVRRARVPRGLGLVPAAFVSLSGYELILEHAVLTDATFIFLVYLSLWCIVRTWTDGRWWALAAGVSLGLATDDRTVGLLLLPVALVCLCIAPPAEINRLLDSRPPSGRGSDSSIRQLILSHRVAWWRTSSLVAGLLGSMLVILPFLIAHDQKTGVFNFTTSGDIALYGRVAPWADCSKFTPPRGTSELCPKEPVYQRPGGNYWMYIAPPPINKITGFAEQTAANSAKMESFAKAAIEGEPLTYLKYVARDFVRVIDPSFSESPNPAVGNSGSGFDEAGSAAAMFDLATSTPKQAIVDSYYQSSKLHPGGVSLFSDWGTDTQLEGPVMAVLLLLAFASPLLAKGLPRRFAWLMVITTVVLIAGPIIVSDYDYRYSAPAFGPLTAAAAIGAYELWQRAAARIRSRRAEAR
jgi:hypothetical protein